MTSVAEYQSVGSTENTDYYSVDGDILVVVPRKGTVDNPRVARVNVDFQNNFARQAGKKCAVVVVMANLLSQDAETRRVYAEGLRPEEFFAIALVVENALSRAIGSFFMGLSKPVVQTRMFDNRESAVAWLRTVREG